MESERFEGMDTAQLDVEQVDHGKIAEVPKDSNSPETPDASEAVILSKVCDAGECLPSEAADALKEPVEPERITVQELINRMGAQASKFGAASRTRLVLINAARALVDLTTRLDAAEREIDRRNEEERPRIIGLPGGRRES